jgi:hypothetical protein
VSATLALARVGKAPTSLSGAIIFANTSGQSCSLVGVPRVRVVNPTGQAIPVFQAPASVRLVRPVILPSSHAAAGGADAGVSITWSDWTCAEGSFALDIRFSGWNGTVTAPYGSTATYSGTPCTSSQETLYVGPVARISAAR